ncbi:TPA_asm: hypothetical protein GZJ24_15235 [Listeria monocytogenes]|nr:hypothetical protein [Listeria monocytogenes]
MRKMHKKSPPNKNGKAPFNFGLINNLCFSNYGVASGKCGFTTIRKFQYKKPDFPSPKLRNWAFYRYSINSITEYVNYFGITGTQSSCLGLCFGP